MPTATDTPQTDPFADLSWSALEQWVGSRSLDRGRSYQKSRRVLLLARTTQTSLAARVAGSEVYTTHVTCHPDGAAGSLVGVCSCPVGGNCKHAVAVVLEYLERLKTGKEIPNQLARLPGDDPLDDDDEDDDDYEDDGEDDDLGDQEADEDELDDADGAGEGSTPERRSGGGARTARKVDVATFLSGLSAPELVDLVTELAAGSEEAQRLLEARARLDRGEVEELVDAAREELRRVSSETGWCNSWNDEGYTPDYSQVTAYLNQLLGAGQTDAVLALGRQVLKLGTDQVGQSHDEGETGMAIAEALVPVWQALTQSSLTPAARILWVYDRYLDDQYDLCNATDNAAIWEVPEGVWGEVAEALIARLTSGDVADVRAENEWDLKYHRSLIGGWAIEALRQAGRADEAVALAVDEARLTDGYQRAVDLLTAADRREEARALALEGVTRTQASLPGIAAGLRRRLRELAAAGDEHALTAAFTAEEFALRPSLAGYRSLREAAQRAAVWEQVRTCVLQSLEDCQPAAAHRGWPLPATGTAPKDDDRQREPSHALLAEIALDEGDPAEALRWYRVCAAEGSAWGGEGLAARVAHGIAATHPDESLVMWKQLAEREIARGNRGGYQESLRYLRPMQDLLRQLGREPEWYEYLTGLRAEHRRRRALLETLGRLDDKPIAGGLHR